MAPAGDCKDSQEAMDDTFYLTNIVPQDMTNNSGYMQAVVMLMLGGGWTCLSKTGKVIIVFTPSLGE